MKDNELRNLFAIAALTFICIAIVMSMEDCIKTWIKEAHKPQSITLTIQTSGFKGTDLLTKKEPL